MSYMQLEGSHRGNQMNRQVTDHRGNRTGNDQYADDRSRKGKTSDDGKVTNHRDNRRGESPLQDVRS